MVYYYPIDIEDLNLYQGRILYSTGVVNPHHIYKWSLSRVGSCSNSILGIF